jgi:hypothetical protein
VQRAAFPSVSQSLFFPLSLSHADKRAWGRHSVCATRDMLTLRCRSRFHLPSFARTPGWAGHYCLAPANPPTLLRSRSLASTVGIGGAKLLARIQVQLVPGDA